MHFNKECLRGIGLSDCIPYVDSKTGNNSEHFTSSPLQEYEKRVRKLMFILPFFLVIGDNFENFVNFLNNRAIRNKKFQMIRCGVMHAQKLAKNFEKKFSSLPYLSVFTSDCKHSITISFTISS